jgi:hypothetical protein
MTHTKLLSALAGLLGAVLLAGCAQTPTAAGAGKTPPARNVRAEAAAPQHHVAPPTPAADPVQAVQAVQAVQVALRDGIEAYNNGDYNAAIRKLSAPEIARSSKANQLSAIKYTAFSYCVSGRPRQCRQQFDKALRIDPAFELDTGEDGHPLWGPVYARARKAVSKTAKSAAPSDAGHGSRP